MIQGESFKIYQKICQRIVRSVAGLATRHILYELKGVYLHLNAYQTSILLLYQEYQSEDPKAITLGVSDTVKDITADDFDLFGSGKYQIK